VLRINNFRRGIIVKKKGKSEKGIYLWRNLINICVFISHKPFVQNLFRSYVNFKILIWSHEKFYSISIGLIVTRIVIRTRITLQSPRVDQLSLHKSKASYARIVWKFKKGIGREVTAVRSQLVAGIVRLLFETSRDSGFDCEL